MTDAPLILRKIAVLREHLARVRRRRPATVEAFRDDVDLQDGVALSLFVAIQEAVDTALHVVADEGWGVPASYAEAFTTLAQHGVDRAAHRRRLGGAAPRRFHGDSCTLTDGAQRSTVGGAPGAALLSMSATRLRSRGSPRAGDWRSRSSRGRGRSR
ncbi:MAG TPA: HepT-like ribonuclease domain-containing protein [Polyangia bacterium]